LKEQCCFKKITENLIKFQNQQGTLNLIQVSNYSREEKARNLDMIVKTLQEAVTDEV